MFWIKLGKPAKQQPARSLLCEVSSWPEANISVNKDQRNFLTFCRCSLTAVTHTLTRSHPDKGIITRLLNAHTTCAKEPPTPSITWKKYNKLHTYIYIYIFISLWWWVVDGGYNKGYSVKKTSYIKYISRKHCVTVWIFLLDRRRLTSHTSHIYSYSHRI